MLKRLVLAATALVALGLAACSGPSQGPPPPFITSPTPTPVSSASAGATPTPTGTGTTPTPSPTPAGTSSPGGTPTPTPIPSGSPMITGSLSSIVVCTQVQTTCPDDLNPNATSGESAGVLVLGVRGTLSLSNAGGTQLATLVSQVYGTRGSQTEWEVTYKSATTSPTTDMLTITDSGTRSSLKIPVSIVSPGGDGGQSFFALFTSSGFVCPGQQVTFETKTKGDATVTLAASDTSLLGIGQNGTGNFVLNILEAGSTVLTATGGPSTVIYPVNIPATGFTPNC